MAVVPLEDLPSSLRGQPVPEDDLPGAKPVARQAKDRTIGEAAQDIGAGVLGGVGSLVQLPGQIGQLAFGMQPGAVTQAGEDIRKYAQSLKSPELVAREQERARKVAEAEKSGQLAAFGTAFGETVKDPALLLTFLAEQAPQLLVPFGAARAGVAGARALGAGAGAAGTAGVASAVGAGAVQQGADVGANAYKDIHDELIRKGASEQEAAEGALTLARQAGASAATISLLTQLLPGARIAERVFAGVPVRGAGRLKAAGAAAAGETISEVPEEVGGKTAANVAMQQVKPEQDILAGTGEAAAMATIGGSTLGGAVGALGRQAAPEVKPAPPPEVVPELPTEPQPPSEVQQRVEGITGVTRGEQQTPAAPVMTAEQVAEQRRREIDEAARAEAQRAAKEGPRPQVPQPQPTDVSRLGDVVPQPTPREDLEAKQAEIDRMRLEAGLPTSKGVTPAEAAEPQPKPGFVRVYHSGTKGDGQTGRWVSTDRSYAANYRKDLPLLYTDIPANDPRVNNPDYPEQGVKQGFTFNFELTPEEATKLREVPRQIKSKELTRPEVPTEPKIVDNRPLNERAAKNRLLVMQNMLQREGGDPNSLSIVPHPTAKGKFAIQSLDRPVQLTPELPQTAITRPESPKIIDPVDAYIEIARRTNTPAAMRLVRDFESGVVTREDVKLAIAAEQRAGKPLPLNYKGNGEPWFLAPEERKPRGERQLPPSAQLTREPQEGPQRPEEGPPKPELTPKEPEAEPAPPTAEMPKTLEEFKQRMGVEREVPAVRAAHEAGNFRQLAESMAASKNPAIKRVGQLALPVADKIKLRKPAAPGKLGGRNIGLYRTLDDSIQIDTRYAGSEWVNAHETVHALVARAQMNPSPKQAPYVQQIEDLYEYAKRDLRKRGYNAKNTYGLTNEREFVSEAMSNPDFQYLLMQVPYKGRKSAWTEFVRIVANLLGISNTSALTEVLNLVDKLAQVKRPIRTPFDRKAVEYAEQLPEKEVSPIGFYSALRESVKGVGTKAAPAEGWKTMIKGMVNKGAVKADEVEWTGINDWLDLQQGKVTKDQVLEYLKQGGVQVDEVVLGGARAVPKQLQDYVDYYGGDTATTKGLLDIAREAERDAQRFQRRGNAEKAEELFQIAELANRQAEFGETGSQATKYGQYTLPGGENYREVLLTLPSQKADEAADIREWRDKMREKYGTVDWRRYATEEEIQKSNEIASRSRAVNRELYRSSHWEQPNVIAHIRMNDRTDADGNRVLFIEEIQSDWGQEGKKKGFNGYGNQTEAIASKQNEIDKLKQTILKQVETWDSATEAEKESYNKNLAALGLAEQELTRLKSGTGVPAAPFVTKTEGWLNLALKRIMVMAAEGGYDKVAFVTGDQSADRYDLSKQVESISYRDNGDGTYKIVAAAVGRGVAIPEQTVERNNLPDVVGKEIADKIVAGEGKSFPPGSVSEGMKELSGLDLKVGGEGMKAFYDKIVPAAVKKLLPKVGGGQMGALSLNIAGLDQPTSINAIREGAKGIVQGRMQNGAIVYLQNDDSWGGRSTAKTYSFLDDAYDAAAALTKKVGTTQQPGFDITPEMRETLSEGVAEFLTLPFGKKEEPAPTGTGQQAMQIVAATGMTAKPPEPTAAERVKTAMLAAKDDPKLAASTAKKGILDFLDKVETWLFSSDAKFNNNIRRGLERDFKEAPELVGMMLEASQSQAVGSDGVATQFIIEGGIAYEDDTKKWVAVKKDDNFIKLAQKIEALAKKHGLSKENAERVAHTYFVAKRFRSLAEKQDQRDAEIAKLEAEAKREQDPVRKKGLRSEIDKLQKAEVYITDQQRALIEPGLSLAKLMPELENISDTWQAIRVNAIKALVDSGMWSLEYAEAMFDNIDYVPFYREEQLEEGGGPQEFIKGLQVKAKEHRLKGSESPVNDVFDNMIRWTQYAINRSIRNHKALQMIDLGKEINVGDQKMVTQVEKKEKGDNVVRVFRDGVQELYAVADPMYMDAFTSINNVAIPSLRFFSWASNALRQSVVLYPLFSLAQVPQDAISAIFTSGLKPQFAFRIPALAVKEFIKTLRKTSATHNILKQYGAVGVRDFSATIARQDVEIATGLKAPKGLIGKTVEGLSHIAMAADNAIRQAVYEAAMDQKLSKAEALEKAFEIINFRRRGTSKAVNLMGQVVPFFYAYMSVQRVALKTISGVGISPSVRSEALKTLGYTTAAVMALSLLYAMAAAGDDEYEKTPVAIRDRTLHIPGTSARIPLRPDFFLFPKMVTEHLYHLITDNGLSDGAKFRKSMFDGFVNAAASPQPIPQAAKPAIEVLINYDFFQQRPIVGPYEAKKEAERQFNDNTSELSKIFGSAMNVSPEKLDHLIRGMLGSVGGLTLWATNLAISPFGEVPRPDKSFQDALASIPGTSGFVTKSTESRLKNNFYELRDEVIKADETFKDIAKRTPQELEAFLDKEKNLVRLGLVKTVEDVSRELSKIRSAISQTTNLPADVMTAAEKKEFIEQLREAEKALLEGIDVQELRKMAKM